MRRPISISMVAVLTVWLGLPVASTHFSPCEMKCCRRATAPHCAHMGTMQASSDAESKSEIHDSFNACLGKCYVKGRSSQFGLGVPGLNSIFFAVQIPAPLLSDLDLRVLQKYGHSGRAPPRTI